MKDGNRGLGSKLISAAEAAWLDIQKRHPEVPDVVIITGSGKSKRRITWGHFCPQRWSIEKGHCHEVLISGERLNLGPEATLATLLHEAAHGLAFEAKVNDTSRQGRYHNRRFKETAESLGLKVEKQGTDGFAHTELTEATVDAYKSTLKALKVAAKIDGPPAGAPVPPPARKSNPLYECGCGRKMRMSPSTAEEGPVMCGLCKDEFAEVMK